MASVHLLQGKVVRLGLHPFDPNRFWGCNLPVTNFLFSVCPSRELSDTTHTHTHPTVYLLSSSFILLAETIQT